MNDVKQNDPDFGFLDEIDGEGEFEGELFLSTDGKNTVHIKASTKDGREKALKWAKKVYEGLRSTYGTKQELNKETYRQAILPANPQTRPCVHEGCQGTQTFRSGISKKNNKPWKAWMCDLSDAHTDWTK